MRNGHFDLSVPHFEYPIDIDIWPRVITHYPNLGLYSDMMSVNELLCSLRLPKFYSEFDCPKYSLYVDDNGLTPLSFVTSEQFNRHPG